MKVEGDLRVKKKIRSVWGLYGLYMCEVFKENFSFLTNHHWCLEIQTMFRELNLKSYFLLMGDRLPCIQTCSKAMKPNELKVLSSSPNDWWNVSILNLMNSMQTSNSLYEDDYSCFTYCYVKGAVLQGYCCIRSILCSSHCFTHTQNILVEL